MARARHESRRETRTNLIEVALELLRQQGESAVTTRAVAEAAGVQPPTIYRLFGDKEGLLDAVTEHAMATYMAEKALIAKTDDPVADLRAGWDVNIGFGLANPALYPLLADPRRANSPAISVGMEDLRSRIRRVAESGRLRVSERRALELIYAAGVGVVLTLLSEPTDARDNALADSMYDAIMRSILTGAPALAEDTATSAAVAFTTFVPELDRLSDAERALLTEWLERAAERSPERRRPSAPT